MLMDESERVRFYYAIGMEVRADPPDMTGALSIPRHGLLGMALEDLELTAYVPEGQFRFVQPDTHQFLATFGICNCIAVFVNSPGQAAFCTHINPQSFEYGLDELKFRRQVSGGVVVSIFKTMSDALTTAFKDVKNSEITVSLVGGWKLADIHPRMNLEKYYKQDKTLRTFSAVVLKCVKDALPGAKINTSCLNNFDGVSWADRTPYSKLKKMAQGQSYDIAALDTHTGQIHLQTSSFAHMVETHAESGDDFMLPEIIAEGAYMHNVDGDKRMWDQVASISNKKMPAPVLHEYVDRDVNERVAWPDIMNCG
jgi:hypothetical protein